MSQRDKHIELMHQVKMRLLNSKGKVRHDLIKHYKKLKKELNRYDNYKRQLTISNH